MKMFSKWEVPVSEWLPHSGQAVLKDEIIVRNNEQSESLVKCWIAAHHCYNIQEVETNGWKIVSAYRVLVIGATDETPEHWKLGGSDDEID